MGRALVILALLLPLAAGSARAAVMKCDNTVRVSISKSGELLIDETKSDLTTLDARLAVLATSKGTVWYYREDMSGEPSSETKSMMTNVLMAILRHGIPYSFSSKADFTDVIGSDGNSSPRNHC